jgi:LuxR family maltose regulon positive regulatory protein
MSGDLLQTKLYVPAVRPNLVPRPQLISRLNHGLRSGHKLTLLSAPAGFGKTTLISEWIAGCERPSAWLSLDEGDNEPTHFLRCFVASLQRIAPNIGQAVLAGLQSPQPPSTQAILTTLLNEIATLPNSFALVLDDYHVIDAQPIDKVLTFLLEHLPPQMHLVITTREDPDVPLARLRARSQLTELRAADLRFTPGEAAAFLHQVMGLNLSAKEVATLETRTEGWIAGLQLAALALQGQISRQGNKNAQDFIDSFSGSHRYVLDYLIEEVLKQQSESVQTFLLQTAVLERLSGSLCDALTGQGNGQTTLEMLDHANLFIVPLDGERRWYRYHHLFADLLRQRLQQGTDERAVADLHIRASQWYENNDLALEAFHHAVAANDVERAARLVEGEGVPLHFRGVVFPILNWLASLPTAVLDARPVLWVMYASALSMVGQMADVEEKLQAAEAALQDAVPDDKVRNLIGHIAAIQALLAAVQNQPDAIITQSHRALEFLHPDNTAVRTATIWKLGIAYHLQGDRAAARRAYSEAISASQASGNLVINISATSGLGNIQEAENQLHQAAQTYRRILQQAGDRLPVAAIEAHLGLARVCYAWNDLDAVQQHGEQGIQLAQQLGDNDRFVLYKVILARLKLAQGDMAGAAAFWAEADRFARRHHFENRLPEVAAAQVVTLIRQGDLAAAADLAQAHGLPLSQARVHLAQGNPNVALSLLEPLRQQVEAKGWQDERLQVMVLQALAYQAGGDGGTAVQLLSKSLALAEPGGIIRLFVDEGPPMAALLQRLKVEDVRFALSEVEGMKEYVSQLLAAFDEGGIQPATTTAQPLLDPLSERELEILTLIAAGLKNKEIAEQLVISLNTVLYHNKNIYGKLGVNKRTQAIAKARKLNLIQ